MNEPSASAPPRDSSTVRRAQRRFDADTRQPELQDLKASPQARMDADMLEVVTTFEQVYATLEPPREVDPHAPLLTDDLFSPFPEEFDLWRSQRRSGEPARVLSVWPEREIVRSVTPTGRVASAPERPADIGLDEAMSILLDAEEKGRAATARQREIEDAEDESASPRIAEAPRPVVRPPTPRPAPAAQPAPALAPKPKPAAQTYFHAWTTRSHRMQSFAIAGAAAALVVGIAVGYTMGRVSDGSSTRARVHASEQGGTHLRVDYELRPR
jgi:hypothetical protein